MAENKRGGKREGAGRKRKAEELRRTTVSFTCTKNEAEMITETSKALGISKSEFICSKLFGKK